LEGGVERIGTRHLNLKSWGGNPSQTVAVLEVNLGAHLFSRAAAWRGCCGRIKKASSTPSLCAIAKASLISALPMPRERHRASTEKATSTDRKKAPHG